MSFQLLHTSSPSMDKSNLKFFSKFQKSLFYHVAWETLERYQDLIIAIRQDNYDVGQQLSSILNA